MCQEGTDIGDVSKLRKHNFVTHYMGHPSEKERSEMTSKDFLECKNYISVNMNKKVGY